MTEEQIRVFLVLKYDSLNHALDLWVGNKIDLTTRERQIIEEYVVEELGGVIKAVELKEHLEYVKADLSTKIRRSPETYGISKVTESVITSAVVLQSGALPLNSCSTNIFFIVLTLNAKP